MILISGGAGWFSSGQSEPQAQLKEVSIDSSVLPTVKTEEGEEVLRMFWIDAYEVVLAADNDVSIIPAVTGSLQPPRHCLDVREGLG